MAKVLTLVTVPDPNLRKVSRQLSEADFKHSEFAELCRDMIKTMIVKDGVGLAAPQIGRNIRLIVVNTDDGPLVMANPKIMKQSWRREWGEEGCLSAPGMFGQVNRHRSVTCAYLDQDQRPHTVEAVGMFARVLQHEIDHLDGILFLDKAKNIKQQ